MIVDRFKLYLFLQLRQYQKDLILSDIEIIETKDKNYETIKEKINIKRIHETDHEKV